MRRPVLTLVVTAAVAVVGLVVAGTLDEQKPFTDPQQAVADIAWVAFLLAAALFVVLAVVAVARTARGRRRA